MKRIDAIRAAFESASSRMPGFTFQQFLQATEDWDVYPVEVGGVLVGAVLMNGPEIHACIKPDGLKRWLTKRVLQNTVCRLLKEHGFVQTHVPKGNAIGEEFVRRMGFQQEGEAWVLRQQ